MPDASSPVQGSRQRAADRLVDLFEAQILDGTFGEGQPLPPEREIVENYGVSRTVVREAVLALSTRGLVKARPGYRPVVVKPGYDTAVDVMGSVVKQLLGETAHVRNLFDLRIMMEVSLVREAADRATRDDIRALRTALEANEAAIGDTDLFYETDIAFHCALYQVPKNPVLPAIHRAYNNWLSKQWRKMPGLVGVNQINFDAHARIFDGILARDPDLAEAALRDHLAFAWEQIGPFLERDASLGADTDDITER